MSEQVQGRSLPPVAVLVATKNRASELANRAVRRGTDVGARVSFLVVVDDSDRRYHVIVTLR